MANVGAVDPSVTKAAEELAVERARITHSFYRHLIASARFFAQRAQAVEKRAARAEPAASHAGELVRQRSYVSGAILSAAAFLEASINELCLELHSVRARKRSGLPRRVHSMLGRFWSDLERAPVLHRYQIVLTVADAERFDERRSPFLEADCLMKLHDALVHARVDRPEVRRQLRNLEQRLCNRFEPNPFAPEKGPWFPDRCLSAGCAEWAVRAADEFTDEFCKRMALPARGLSWYDANFSRSRDVEVDRPVVRADHVNGSSPNEAGLPESGR